MRHIGILLEAIKFEHTIFALPFALMAALVAVDGMPSSTQLGWVLLAMVGARSSAMMMNRILDLPYDRQNPRTAMRAIPAGNISLAAAWSVTVIAAALLVLAAYMLNPLAFALSPVALTVIWGYSLTKRFTAVSHLVLGLALGIAPAAVWISLTGHLDQLAMLLSGVVLCWTAGFDIIYACQDVEFDRTVGLFSLPASTGLIRALAWSSLLHFFAFVLLIFFGSFSELGFGYWLALIPVALLLIAQHRMVRPDDLHHVNAAFFTANGAISLLLLAGTAFDILR